MTQHADLLARYRRLRQVGIELNNKLLDNLPKNATDEGGKKLGILERKTLVFDTEDEIAVLMDFCIHDVRRNGMNAVERRLAETPPAADSDEIVLLQALRQARFSLVVVEATEPGVGVHVRDLLRDEPLFLVDVGFSRSAAVGLMLAARFMAPDGIGMTTGAPLPVGMLSPDERDRFLRGMKASFPRMDLGNPSQEESSEFAAVVIRECLRLGAAERIEYADPGQGGRRGQALPPLAQSQRAGRNDPCPCGSGRKYKRCCGGSA